MDILAATGAFQVGRGGEDVPHYGGLFRVTYNSSTPWNVEDLTPWSRNNIDPLYKIDYPGSMPTPFSHPAVGCITKYTPTGSNRSIYYCSTSGEPASGDDNHLALLWYQVASDMRGLTRARWRLYPGGQIPFGNGGNRYYTYGISAERINSTTISANGVLYANINMPADDQITSNTTWEGQVELINDVTMTNGATLTLKPGCQITSLGYYGLIVDSGYVKVQYPDSARPLFTTPPDVRWKGITIKNMHPDSILTLKKLEIRNADYGIYLDGATGRTVKVKIENCLFDSNGVGVGARQADQIIVKNCEIKNGYKGGDFNGDGIYFFSLSSNGTHAVENCIIHHNDGCGIRLSSCPSSLTLYNNDIHDNLEQNSTAYSSWAGVYCYNSSPKIRANEISESHGYPLATFNSSAPYLCKGPDSTNVFELAMTPPDTYAVILADAGFPVMNSAYNNFSHGDCDDDLLIDDLTNPSTKRKVVYNWWGVNPPVSAQFSPSDSIVYNPYLTSAESFPTGLPSRGPYSGDSTAYDLLDNAIADYYSGDYTEAYWTLSDIIENHADETEVVCMALPYLLQTGPKVPVSLAVLYDYLGEVEGSNGENLIGKTARKVRNDCSVLMAEYLIAINDYQSIISNPPTLSDSVFAILDANQANLIMNGSGMPGTQSMAPASPLNPVTFQEYMKREAGLLALITQSKGATASSVALLPKTFALHQNFPNPFNPATTIRYDLPEISHVKISIYNMLGQKVVTLVDRTVEAGYQRATWDMSRSGNALASGLYIYQIVAEGKETGKKFITARKMLMIK